MSKIRMETDNLFPFPKGAYIGNKRSGAVYINVSNEYVPPGEKVKEPGSRGYTGHEKKCIGKVPDPSASSFQFFYANDSYRRDFLHLDIPELPDPPRLADSISVGLHGWIEEASVISKLTETLADVFDEDAASQILDLAHYMISKESAVMQHYPAWARENMIFSSDIMNDTEIGQFLKKKLSVSKIKQFRYKWAVLNLSGTEGVVYLCYDSTNVNCQATGVSIVQKGHAKDDPSLPQVNTDYVIRQSDGMPITYLHSPGSVTDIAQAQEMIRFFEDIGKEIGKKIRIVLICDRGYISEKNVRLMDAAGIEYILMLRSNFNLYEDLSSQWVDSLKSYEYKLETDDEEKFGLTVPCQIFKDGKQCYAHVIWSEDLYRSKRNSVDNYINEKRKSVEAFIPAHCNSSFTIEEINKLLPTKLFSLFLEQTGTKDVERKEGRGRGVHVVIDKVPVYKITGFEDDKAAINRERQKCGISILISSEEMTAQQVIDAYAKRDCVEKAFESLKSHLGMDKIGVTTEEAMHGKGLIWFIASILYSLLFNGTSVLRVTDKKHYTVPAMVDVLEAIKADKNLNSNKYERRYKLTKRQMDILDNWKIVEARIDKTIALLNAA